MQTTKKQQEEAVFLVIIFCDKVRANWRLSCPSPSHTHSSKHTTHSSHKSTTTDRDSFSKSQYSWIKYREKNGRWTSICLSKVGMDPSWWLVAKSNSLEEKHHRVRCLCCHCILLCLSHLREKHGELYLIVLFYVHVDLIFLIICSISFRRKPTALHWWPLLTRTTTTITTTRLVSLPLPCILKISVYKYCPSIDYLPDRWWCDWPVARHRSPSTNPKRLQIKPIQKL